MKTQAKLLQHVAGVQAMDVCGREQDNEGMSEHLSNRESVILKAS